MKNKWVNKMKNNKKIIAKNCIIINKKKWYSNSVKDLLYFELLLFLKIV